MSYTTRGWPYIWACHMSNDSSHPPPILGTHFCDVADRPPGEGAGARQGPPRKNDAGVQTTQAAPSRIGVGERDRRTKDGPLIITTRTT